MAESGFRTEIVPIGIRGFYERDFLRSRPALELFFAGNGSFDIGSALDVHEAIDVVLLREARRV
jgi:hypothetical protein